MPCKVTVLPVPVAPAISPWRLARDRSRLCGLPPPDSAPMKMPLPLTPHLLRPAFAQQQRQRKPRRRKAALLARDVDPDEGLWAIAALDQQQNAGATRPFG